MVHDLYFGPLPKHQFFKSVNTFSVLILSFISSVEPINVRLLMLKLARQKLQVGGGKLMSCLQGLLGNKHRRSKGEVFEKKSFCTLSCSNVELALLQGPHMHFDQAFSCSNCKYLNIACSFAKTKSKRRMFPRQKK